MTFFSRNWYDAAYRLRHSVMATLILRQEVRSGRRCKFSREFPRRRPRRLLDSSKIQKQKSRLPYRVILCGFQARTAILFRRLLPVSRARILGLICSFRITERIERVTQTVSLR